MAAAIESEQEEPRRSPPSTGALVIADPMGVATTAHGAGTSTATSGIGKDLEQTSGTGLQGAIGGDQVASTSQQAPGAGPVSGPSDRSMSAGASGSGRASAGRSHSDGQPEGPSDSG